MGRWLAAVVSALLLVSSGACGGAPEEPAPEPPVAQDTPGIDPEAPPVEDPEVLEEPDDPGDDPVAVELPGLPVGGTSEVVSTTLQCVDVGWSGPDIPEGIRIGLDGVAFLPADGFVASDEPCPGEAPRCVGEGFWITAALERCAQAVAWTGAPTIDAERMLMYTGGVVACVPERMEECREFGEAVLANGPESIELQPGPAEVSGGAEGEPSPDPDEPAPDDGDGATDLPAPADEGGG